MNAGPQPERFMRRLVVLAALLAGSSAAFAADATCRLDHAVVSYAGIGDEYAKAIARTVQAARTVALDQFDLDMPESILVHVECEANAAVRLYNDGQDRLFLTIRSERDLRKPGTTGIFHLYGLCHEVAHLAMYRSIRDHGWMTTAAAEGWAHFLGSRIVDGVHALEGKDLWPDAYDYLADGTRRLDGELAGKDRSPVTRGAGLWKELVRVVGDKGVAKTFEAWGRSAVDPTDPGPVLRKTLLATHADKRLADWWEKAEPVFVLKRPASGFTARTAEPKDLTGKPLELALDDGVPAGKRSLAGGGHAVRLKPNGPGWYLTGVKIYGTRYGQATAPDEKFHVWLCDGDFRTITEFEFPYSSFPRGTGGWVTLSVKPTNVPQEFILCVGFNPTATKGVFVHHDKGTSGGSLVGLPGEAGREFAEGDWLIRPIVDQLKTSDALKPLR